MFQKYVELPQGAEALGFFKAFCGTAGSRALSKSIFETRSSYTDF